ncbi:MAG: helix-turn-helix domain-containing protein [Coprobacillus sp.]
MISYQPFWETLKKKQMTGYRLNKSYGVSRSLIDKLKHNKDIRLSTLSDLCQILDCQIEDIVEITNEEK